MRRQQILDQVWRAHRAQQRDYISRLTPLQLVRYRQTFELSALGRMLYAQATVRAAKAKARANTRAAMRALLSAIWRKLHLRDRGHGGGA